MNHLMFFYDNDETCIGGWADPRKCIPTQSVTLTGWMCLECQQWYMSDRSSRCMSKGEALLD